MVAGKKGVSTLLIAVGIGALIVILAVVFWPRTPQPIGLLVAVQGKPTAGSDLVLQVTVKSEKARDVTLVAEMFNTNRQLVNIVRDQVAATKGEQITVMKMAIPATLPPGRYNAVVTARYDQTHLVTQETAVLVAGAPAPVAVTPVTPPVPENASQPTTPVAPENVTPVTPTVTQENVTPTPVASPENETTQPAAQAGPETIDIENIADVAKTDRKKALDYCAAQPSPDNTLCVSRVAVALQDSTLCARLGTQYDQDKCYLSMASAGQAQACALVQDPALKATCQAVSSFYGNVVPNPTNAIPTNETSVSNETLAGNETNATGAS